MLTSTVELFFVNPIVALIIYVVTFVIIALLFSSIDFSKILREEYRTLTMGTILYFVFTAGVTFVLGTFFLVLINIISSL